MEGRNSCVAAAILLCILSTSLLTHGKFTIYFKKWFPLVENKNRKVKKTTFTGGDIMNKNFACHVIFRFWMLVMEFW